MPYLSKKRVWTRQPQYPARVNKGALGAPIKHLWALDVKGEAGCIDSVSGADGVFGSGSGVYGNKWERLPSGDSIIRFSDVGTGGAGSTALYVGNSSGSAAPSGNQFTLICRVFIASSSGYQQYLYSAGAGAVALRTTTDGTRLELMKEASALIAASSTAFALGGYHWIAVSYDGALARFYVDSNPVESGGSAYTFSSASQATLGYSLFGGSSYKLQNGGGIGSFLIADDALPEAAIRAYFNNPNIVFRRPALPFIVPSTGGGVHTTTGIITSDVATISGTSLHKILHIVVGNLTSSSASLTGTSVHTTPAPTHETVGVLSASNSSITGIAARYREHQTTGILTTTNATINGTTNNFSVITSTGVLSSDVATLAGVMSITPAPGIHISTGVLQSNSATITGILTHTATGHTLTGTLVSNVATLNGNVAHNIIHNSSGTLVSSVATINGTASSSGIMTLTPADIEAIANAVWQHPWALTLPKWLALK